MRQKIEVVQSQELLCHMGHMRSCIILVGTGSLDASGKGHHVRLKKLGKAALSCDPNSLPMIHVLKKNWFYSLSREIAPQIMMLAPTQGSLFTTLA